jgi:hypothetical protein
MLLSVLIDVFKQYDNPDHAISCYDFILNLIKGVERHIKQAAVEGQIMISLGMCAKTTIAE